VAAVRSQAASHGAVCERTAYGEKAMNIRCYTLPSVEGGKLIGARRPSSNRPNQPPSWDALSVSVRGARHVQEDIPNQDAACTVFPVVPAGGVVIAVADGHGSSEYVRSDRGSQFACQAATDWGVKFLTAVTRSPETPIRVLQGQMLSRRIHDDWLAAVRQDLAQCPLAAGEWEKIPENQLRRFVDRPETAYGSTLLMAVAWNSGLLVLQLGDGDVVGFSGGSVRHLVEPLGGPGPGTDSLCDQSAVDKFRIYVDSFADGAPECVMVRTDGWMNSFEKDADRERTDLELFRWLQSASKEAVEADLESLLAETSASGWSQGDDVSCAMLFLKGGGSHVS